MSKIDSQKGAVEISTFAGMAIIAAFVVAVSIIATSKYYEGIKTVEPVAVISPKLTLIPTPKATITPTLESTIELTPSPSVEDIIMSEYLTKELLGENEDYSVYLLDSVEALPGRKGKIAVYDKNKKIAINISGLFKIFGATIVSNDDGGKYVILSNGTYTSRDIVILSLFDKKQAIKNFCAISGNPSILFWNDYLLYTNCDEFQNRPWGSGEAPSIATVNLVNGQTKILFKSDLFRDYHTQKIEGNTLFYRETSVVKETDWNSEKTQKNTAKTFTLSAF